MIEQPDNTISLRPTKAFDPIGTIARHWVKIAVFGTVLFVLMSPVALFKTKAFYKADGKLLIAPSVQTLIARAEDNPIAGYYRDYVQTQCERIHSRDTIETALGALAPDIRRVFVADDRKMAQAARMLVTRFKVEYVRGTHFISVSLAGDHPEGLAQLVNAVMVSYLEQTRSEAEGQESRRLQYLQDEKQALDAQISQLTARYKNISGVIGSVDFKEAGNIHNDMLKGLQQEHIRAYTERIKKENDLKAAVREAEALKALPIDADVEAFVLNSGVASEMDIQTYRQIQSLKESLEGLSDNNPDRAVIANQIENLTTSLDYSKDMLKARTRRILEAKREAQLQEKIALARSECETARLAEAELKQRLDAVAAQKSAISDKILDGQQVEKELERLQDLYTRIEDRINVLRMEARGPGRISLESRALPPRGPAGSNFKKLIVLCFVAAFGGICLVCVLFDLADKRVRSRKDVLDAIGAKVTWPISDYLVTRTIDVPFSRATRDDSANVVSKAIHSLAVRLDRERRERGAKLAVFTGVDDRSGTSEIMANVAYAMTRLCKRVLVIDANLINPSSDRVFLEGIPTAGLVEHMREEIDFQESIVRIEDRQFDLLPAGQLLLMSEINLIDRSKFPPMFQRLKEHYDVILVDTPPVLVSDFTEFLILNADMVSLIVQGDRSRYDALFMVGDIFRRLRVKAVAVVLNWGAPRERNRAQIFISRILAPITKRIITSPFWDVRHRGLSSRAAEQDNGRAYRMLLNRLRRLKRLDKKIMVLICLVGAFLGGGRVFFASLPARHPAAPFFRVPGENSVALPAPVVAVDSASKDGGESGEKAPLWGLPMETDADVQVASSSNSRMEGPAQEKSGGASRATGLRSAAWILAQSPRHYTIQLMGASEKTYLDLTAMRLFGSGTLAYYKKIHAAMDWYVLIFNVFSDRAQASAALEALPDKFKVNSPWIRRMDDVQQEIFTARKLLDAPRDAATYRMADNTSHESSVHYQ